MAIIRTSSYLVPSSYSACKVNATLHNPQDHASNISVSRDFTDELIRRNRLRIMTQPSYIELQPRKMDTTNRKVVQELYTILEIVGERAEMHKNIGQQMDNRNRLLLISVNRMTVTAAIMAGLAAAFSGGGGTLLSLKLSSTILYMSATGMLLVMNKIQPSKLAEEQMNASRLFKKLHGEIKRTLAYREPSSNDVKHAMEKTLALDKVYPLPLIGEMLHKFPKVDEPAFWWPKEEISHEDLEEEMNNIVGTLKRKDTAEYMRLSEIAKKVNKILAICSPLFTGIAALGSAFMGSSVYGSWAALSGLIFGSLATVINTLEHGGQVGMAFEMYRSSAGYFKLLEENTESTLKEKEFIRREDGSLSEMKMALQLGRSLEELRDLASHSSLSSSNGQTEEDCASKLY